MDMYMDMFMWVPLHFLFYGALRLHGSMCLQAPACVSFRDPCIAFTVVLFTCRVNVNTTDATTGATALLLPAQNTPCVRSQHTHIHIHTLTSCALVGWVGTSTVPVLGTSTEI